MNTAAATLPGVNWDTISDHAPAHRLGDETAVGDDDEERGVFQRALEWEKLFQDHCEEAVQDKKGCARTFYSHTMVLAALVPLPDEGPDVSDLKNWVLARSLASYVWDPWSFLATITLAWSLDACDYMKARAEAIDKAKAAATAPAASARHIYPEAEASAPLNKFNISERSMYMLIQHLLPLDMEVVDPQNPACAQGPAAYNTFTLTRVKVWLSNQGLWPWANSGEYLKQSLKELMENEQARMVQPSDECREIGTLSSDTGPHELVMVLRGPVTVQLQPLKKRKKKGHAQREDGDDSEQEPKVATEVWVGGSKTCRMSADKAALAEALSWDEHSEVFLQVSVCLINTHDFKYIHPPAPTNPAV